MDDSTIDLARIRSDYQLATLSETEVGDDPLLFFKKWLLQAQDAQITEVNAMTLATVDDAGMPHARIVLLKGLEDDGFVFFTNYNSNKGKQIMKHNKVSLLFFWKELERQVRIEGKIEMVSAESSDRYFYSRPKLSQIGAAASPQSQIIDSRTVLEKKIETLQETYKDKEIPRPSHWGGYIVRPYFMEFWQGRRSRLHDRIAFEKKVDQGWKIYRLAP